jgi:DNA-binding GntR family transcriptional regulator
MVIDIYTSIRYLDMPSQAEGTGVASMSGADQATSTSRPRLVRRPGTALYSEVTRDLRLRIDRGEFAAGQRLPAEMEFARRYGVNRLTVRRALSDLARCGVIRTEHGVGSFVREPVVRHRIDDGHASLSESMTARGRTVTHEVISAGTAPEEDQFSQWPGEVVRLRYLRLLDGIPWSLSAAVLPGAIAPAGWDGSASLAALLQDRGTPVVRAERAFSAGAADGEDARWLDIEPGTPILVVAGINTDLAGHDIMRVRHHTRADRAEYVVRLPGSRR